jgi:DNA-3-methyladenine glycosylase
VGQLLYSRRWRLPSRSPPIPDQPLAISPPLSRDFYAQPTIAVALRLLGAYLVHDGPGGRQVGRVVETEAYVGPDDRASHASRGRTRRTALMFGPPGYAYVYLVYGMHYCLNVVTEGPDYPAAVLLRALEPLVGISLPTSGPGRLCRALGIDGAYNGADLTAGSLYLAGGPPPTSPVVAAPRVGVPYAGAWALKPWRFYLVDSPWVSRRRRRARAAGLGAAVGRGRDVRARPAHTTRGLPGE